MWSKIYFAVLGLAIAIVGFFDYYSWSWLQSIGQPTAVIEGYEYNRGLAWMALWVFTVILLFVGNAILWAGQRAWAIWLTFVFFAFAIMLSYFWLDQILGRFVKDNGFNEATFSLGPLFAVVWIALMAGLVFLTQIVVIKIHKKMYPIESTPVEEILLEDVND